MIHYMANKMTSIFVLYGESSDEDRDIYIYACETLLSTLANILLGLLIAFMVGRLVDGIVFMLGFAVLRRYAGGHHANTHKNCILTFAIVLLCSMVALTIISRLYIEGILPLAATVAMIGIFILSPVEHENKPLSADLQVLLKKQSRWISFTIWILCIIDFYLLSTGIGLPLSLSISAVVGSAVYAVINKRKEGNDYGKTNIKKESGPSRC